MQALRLEIMRVEFSGGKYALFAPGPQQAVPGSGTILLPAGTVVYFRAEGESRLSWAGT